MTIVTVLGTRPEIIKMAPLLPRLDALGDHIIVHSGQHYSAEMDAVFFEELELRSPDRPLGVGSREPAEQVAMIAQGVERVIIESSPDWVVVHGDTNTTLGGALAAAKHRARGVRLAHVEAGARSFNEDQPEELNRVLVDRMAHLLFAPTEDDAANLKAEGIPVDRVLVTGNTVAESCLRMATIVDGHVPDGLAAGHYAIATIHRQETVNDPARLATTWEALVAVSECVNVIVPLHPRTRKMLAAAGLPLSRAGLTVSEPVGYRKMVALLKHARFVLTDSGGVQEEAAILQVPALVLRGETEHRRYVDAGLHRVVGTDFDRIVAESTFLLDDDRLAERKRCRIELDSGVAERIASALTSVGVSPR